MVPSAAAEKARAEGGATEKAQAEAAAEAARTEAEKAIALEAHVAASKLGDDDGL